MIIKRITGLTIRFGDEPGWLPPNASPPLPQTANFTLEIEENEDGYLLLSASNHEHLGGGDTWHSTLQDALAQAEFQFGVRPDEWADVAEPASVSPAEPGSSVPDDTTILYRPVGKAELGLIQQSGFRSFPPRLPGQPIFYPVLTEEYAVQVARDWNAKHNDDHCGFVTRFRVRTEFLKKYTVQTVGGKIHKEYWIPAEQLDEFNQKIVGLIEVLSEFKG